MAAKLCLNSPARLLSGGVDLPPANPSPGHVEDWHSDTLGFFKLTGNLVPDSFLEGVLNTAFTSSLILPIKVVFGWINSYCQALTGVLKPLEGAGLLVSLP